MLTPIRILNVIRYPIGGIRSYLRYTYPRFEPGFCSTTILTVNIPEAQLLPAGLAPIDVELETVPEKHALLNLARSTRRLLGSGRFDLVHSQGATAALASAAAAWRYSVPHVVTLHETFRAEQFVGVVGAVKRRAIASVLKRAACVVTVSSDARDNLMEYLPIRGAALEHIDVIRNGVAVEKLLVEAEHSRQHLRQRWAIDDDVVLLGFIGRFMPEKGFDVLLEAARRLVAETALPKFRIVALNDGAYVREYRQQIVDWGLESSFVFAGFQASAAGTLLELDAVVVPSRREACPLVAMEAMTLGCPLIASDCIGLRELTVNTPAIQSVAGDPGSLADAIRTLLVARAAKKEQSQAFISTARRSFDSSRTAESLARVFSRTLDMTTPRRSAAPSLDSGVQQ